LLERIRRRRKFNVISSVAESLPKAAVESHAKFQLIETHRAREFAKHSCRVD